MARQDERQGIPPQGLADSPARAGPPDMAGKPSITPHFTERHLPECRPYSVLKGCSPCESDLLREGAELASEVRVELSPKCVMRGRITGHFFRWDLP